ncbi:eIF-2-alpha kinase GCN2-like [Miscanthus floridulus]|uniref:eIF-2-alpha kinase GCN2-like n=1 Tax=Miscanthus floridulus TaxID=154761 RepID=UPI00345B3807
MLCSFEIYIFLDIALQFIHLNTTQKSKPPGAVGVSIALEKFLPNNPSSDLGLRRIEPSISVLVCSRGGGGLLTERMELVAELWKANIKAQFVPQEDPSLQEQYEYASDHDIKCLAFSTESGLSQTDLVKELLKAFHI